MASRVKEPYRKAMLMRIAVDLVKREAPEREAPGGRR